MEIMDKTLLICCLFIANICCSDKLPTIKPSTNDEVKTDFENLCNTDSGIIGTSKAVCDEGKGLKDDIKTKRAPTLHQKKQTSIQLDEETINNKGPINTIGSGLIQTIRMDLQPDRDNFLPLKTTNSQINDDTVLSYSSYLLVPQHRFTMSNDYSHFIDDMSDLQQGLRHTNDGQWHERMLYQDIGDKISSSQHVL